MEAAVRIDFVIVDSQAAVLARIAFCVRGVALSITAGEQTHMECDQEIIVPEAVWQECLGGRLLRRDLYNLCVNRQLKPFKPAVAGLRYFINYYFDLGDISPWMRISGQQQRTDNLAEMRALRGELSPKFHARDLRDEYLPAGSPQ